MGSHAGSDFSQSIIDDRNRRPGMDPAAPVAGITAAAAGALADRAMIRPVGTDPLIQTSGTIPANAPPAPPTHVDSSGSEMLTTASGRQKRRHHLGGDAAAGLAGAALGAAAANTARRRHSGRNTDSMESPPVSLKVKMHNDGRHVTLRRLTEEEANVQREARRRERRESSSRRRRNSSISSSSAGEHLGADRRWRRTGAVEAAQAQADANAAGAGAPPIGVAGPSTAAQPQPPPHDPAASTVAPYPAIDPRTGEAAAMPPPPPIPGTASGLGPPGSAASPGTETSTEYANNRRRRRAQRAQARLATEGRSGGTNTVEFT